MREIATYDDRASSRDSAATPSSAGAEGQQEQVPRRSKRDQLRDHLIHEIMAGRLKPGQATPSERQLQQMFGVARMTVCQAMTSLENQGLIRRVQGKGTFVEAGARRKLRRGLDIFALVVPETRAGYYPSLLYGFEAAAGALHHKTIVCNTANSVLQQGDIVFQLLDQEVGGVAINPTTDSQTPAYQVRQLQRHGIPVVFCHRRVDGVAAPLLALPFDESGRLAGKTLAERGHRRVAFFTASGSACTCQYEQGLGDGLKIGGCENPPECVYVGDSIYPTEEAVFAALKKTFTGSHPPTAVYASFDSLAEVIYLLLPRLGLRVPEDVSLIGEGGTWRKGAIARRLTSIVVDEAATGRKAVALLDEMRRGERPIDDNEEFTLRWDVYEGATLAAPPATAIASK